MSDQPQGSIDLDDLRNTFAANSDCYADVVDGQIVMAMTQGVFVSVVQALLADKAVSYPPTKVDQVVSDQPPKYVSLGGTALSWDGRQYYRPAGAWGVGFTTDADGVMWSTSPVASVNVKRLVPCSEYYFLRDNAGYVDNTSHSGDADA